MSRWNTVAIYGVGLIGGSIGMAVRERKLANRVVGIGRSPERLQQAKQLGAIDQAATSLDDVQDPDIVVLCAPVQLLLEHCHTVSAAFPNAFITDAGSTKHTLVEHVSAQLPEAKFVGSHPLAGSDKSGVQFSHGSLLVDRLVILTPDTQTPPEVTTGVREFWQAIGAKTIEMSSHDHDQALAFTSHLPHIVAAALAANTPADYLALVAGGWRDTTRIAGADVELWTQILQENSENVLAALQRMQANLQAFQSALAEDNRDSITRLLAAGKQRRDALGS